MTEYDYGPETLIHYRHRSCPGTGDPWWSISGGGTERDYYCPYCGQRLSPNQYAPSSAPFVPDQEIEL